MAAGPVGTAPIRGSPPGGITAGWQNLAIGSTLAGYRIDALIARGGMGVVYRATHLASNGRWR